MKRGRQAIVLGGPIIDPHGARERVLTQSVMSKTLDGYRAKVAIYNAFLKQSSGRGDLSVAEQESFWYCFCETYCEKSTKASKTTLESYRSAIMFLQSIGEFPGKWAEKEDVRKACVAARYAGGLKKVGSLRGALGAESDEGKYILLQNWLTENGELNMLDFVVSCYGTHSRLYELAGLKNEDVFLTTGEVDERGKVRGITETGICIPNKCFNAGSQDYEKPFIIKSWDIISSEAKEILEARKKATKVGQLLFPTSQFKLTHLRACMKKALGNGSVETLELTFSSPHCLRHGRIATLVADGRGAVLKSSIASLKRYGAPNVVRNGKGRNGAKKEFLNVIKKIAKQRKQNQ